VFTPSSEHAEYTSAAELLRSISNAIAPAACHGFWFAYLLGIPHRTETGRSGSNGSQMGLDCRVQRAKNQAPTRCKQYNTAHFQGCITFSKPPAYNWCYIPTTYRIAGRRATKPPGKLLRYCLGSAE